MPGKKIHSKILGLFPSSIYQLLSQTCNIETIALLCKQKIVSKMRFSWQHWIYPAQDTLFLRKKYHIRTIVINHSLST